MICRHAISLEGCIWGHWQSILRDHMNTTISVLTISMCRCGKSAAKTENVARSHAIRSLHSWALADKIKSAHSCRNVPNNKKSKFYGWVNDREKTSQVLSTNDPSYRQLEGQLEGHFINSVAREWRHSKVIAWFGINTTRDISKLLYVISRAVSWVKFETTLKYHEWYLCQISRTNHAIICLYHRYFKLSWNTTALSQSNCRNFSFSGLNLQILSEFCNFSHFNIMTKDGQTWRFNDKSQTKVRNSLILSSVCLSEFRVYK